ncbi:hypothetical protein ADK70_04860 [Streptomyces rimosus subsp. pseudoverticillatus]|nr:hypothetical protein ADK70_04860 [Streptomyces rimosus subsp. pseudoverticillatus]
MVKAAAAALMPGCTTGSEGKNELALEVTAEFSSDRDMELGVRVGPGEIRLAHCGHTRRVRAVAAKV